MDITAKKSVVCSLSMTLCWHPQSLAVCNSTAAHAFHDGRWPSLNQRAALQNVTFASCHARNTNKIVLNSNQKVAVASDFK